MKKQRGGRNQRGKPKNKNLNRSRQFSRKQKAPAAKNRINFDTPKTKQSYSQTKRSWQKPEQSAKTKKQQKVQKQKERKKNDNLMKVIIMTEISSNNADIKRIKQSLSKIKSRGLKQRLKKKAVAAGLSFG